MIDRYLLRYFLAVVDHGNFSRAAQHCRVTQPTLSVGIAKLETSLGRPLFLRSNRRVELTAAGTRFAVHARRIEAEFAEAERAVLEDAPRRLVRIGIVPTLPAAWIERAVAAARGTGERIELIEGRMRDLTPMLDRGRIDAILGPVSSQNDALFAEGYALALSADHPLAGRTEVGAEEVAGETMIVRRHCEALPEISRFFTARGVRPFMAARTTNDERALAYVRSGLGITVMPRCFAGDGIAMVTLTGFATTRSIGFTLDADSAARLKDSAAFAGFGEAIRTLAYPVRTQRQSGMAWSRPTQTVRPELVEGHVPRTGASTGSA
jgi:DNA-binding transcriptional LysR family regulator